MGSESIVSRASIEAAILLRAIRPGKYNLGDGVTVDVTSGGIAWKLNGKLHREDGPAVEFSAGGGIWYRHGLRHREDAPAVIRPTGKKEWWVDGEYVRQ